MFLDITMTVCKAKSYTDFKIFFKPTIRQNTVAAIFNLVFL